MDDSMKEWSKPELVVLVRHNPEEAVLTACKEGGKLGPGLGFCNQGAATGANVQCEKVSTT